MLVLALEFSRGASVCERKSTMMLRSLGRIRGEWPPGAEAPRCGIAEGAGPLGSLPQNGRAEARRRGSSIRHRTDSRRTQPQRASSLTPIWEGRRSGVRRWVTSTPSSQCSTSVVADSK
jgi:hypothetical protein